MLALPQDVYYVYRSNFWEELLLTSASFEELCHSYPLVELPDSGKLLIIIYFLTSVYAVPKPEDLSALNYGKRTLLLTDGTEELAAFEINSNTFCSVLHVPDDVSLSRIEDKTKELAGILFRNNGLKTASYYMKAASPETAKDTYSTLYKRFRNDVERAVPVRNAEMLSEGTDADVRTRSDDIAELLLTQKTELLISTIRSRILDMIPAGQMRYSNLKSYRHAIEQAVFLALDQFGIGSNELYNNKFFDDLGRMSVFSVEYTLRYLNEMISLAQAAIAEHSVRSNAVEEVKRYIQEHPEEELTRETLARHVYLHPDYLARRFKNECGIPLSAYIRGVRIEKAKTLLRSTSIPVHEIARQCGFSQASYFSGTFEKETGVLPLAFRKMKTPADLRSVASVSEKT